MLTDFYTISNWESNENELNCTLAYNAAHPVFEGHFPQQPVVPGVCTMHIVKELLEKALRKKLVLTEAAQVKFLQLQLPHDQPLVKASWKWDNELLKVTVGFTKEQSSSFKMNAIYTAC